MQRWGKIVRKCSGRDPAEENVTELESNTLDVGRDDMEAGPGEPLVPLLPEILYLYTHAIRLARKLVQPAATPLI